MPQGYIMNYEEMKEHIKNGCSYGQPSGPDDFNECCDCEDEECS